jgi:hypothetical protein
MPSSSAQRAPTVEYLNCVEREDELVRLRNQARIRKSLLLYGPEGVGKSRLLRAFVKNQTLALYVGQMRSPRDFALILIQALHSADGGIKVPGNLSALSTSSLKGILHRALDTRPFLMVLDHLDAPSRVVTGMIKDLHYYGRTPVIFASRSPHMEDIGALRPLCANKSERLELKNLPPQIALESVRCPVETESLTTALLTQGASLDGRWSSVSSPAIRRRPQVVAILLRSSASIQNRHPHSSLPPVTTLIGKPPCGKVVPRTWHCGGSPGHASPNLDL